MKTCAFVTYNQLGEGNVESGWHEKDGRRALVLQNTKGRGALNGPDSNGGIGPAARVEQIDLLWAELERALPALDGVVLYLGANGSQKAIAVLAEARVPADKVAFVGCDCGLPLKELMIQTVGLGEAKRFLCDCGGHHAMLSLYERFMATGSITPTAH